METERSGSHERKYPLINAPLFFPQPLLPPLCPHSNLSTFVESRKLDCERWACCLQAKAIPTTDIHVHETWGKICLKNLSAWRYTVESGTQWMSIITHIVLSSPFMQGIIKQISVWNTEPGKVLLRLCVFWDLVNHNPEKFKNLSSSKMSHSSFSSCVRGFISSFLVFYFLWCFTYFLSPFFFSLVVFTSGLSGFSLPPSVLLKCDCLLCSD